jgi:hypothetical protein
MSLYLAKKIPTTQDPPAAFLAKKLGGYTPAPVGSLAILGVSKYPEVAYGVYRSNIDAFCAASFSNKKVFAQAEGFGNAYVSKPEVPFSCHPVAFSPSSKLSPDQANLLLKKLGEDSSMKYIGKTLEYTIPHPLPEQLDKLLISSNPNFSVGPDRFTPSGYQAYQKAISLLEMFLQTNYYPAFKNLDQEIPQGPPMSVGYTGPVDKKKRDYFYDYKADLNRGSIEVADYHSVLKRRRLMKEASGDEAMEVDVSDVLDEETQGRMTFEDINSSVVYAKPSGRPSSVNFGGPGGCPQLPGLVFPYFKGMTRPDFTTIRECFVNFFFRLFGNDFESCKANLLEIKRGVNNLSNTEGGMEITHAMKGVELALRTQTRLYLVFDKGYRGFVLLGAHFSVWDGSMWIDPVSPEKIDVELSRMDTHKISISAICEMLSKVEISRSKIAVDIGPEEIDCAAALIRELSIRDFTDYKETAEFDKNLQGLIWKTPYTQLSPDTFLTFLNAFFSGDEVELKDSPVYIPSCQAPVTDRLFQLLARFGPDAPSLWNARGEVISVISRQSKKGKEKEGLEQPAVPKEIIILPKPILIAMKDWQKVIKDAAVSFNYKERARGHRGHVVSSESMKEKIWKALQSGLDKVDTEALGEPSKKKSRKELDVVTADDILNLW